MVQLMSVTASAPPVPETLWQSWNLSPTIMVALLLAAVLYGRGIKTVWQQAGPGRAVSYGRVIAFALGLLTLVVALVTPLDALSEALLSAHMVQHLLLMLLAAPLLVYGVPPAALAWATPRPWRRRVARWWHRSHWLARLWAVLSHPGVVWGLHAAAVWLWHLPSFYQAALLNETVHVLEHGSFLAAALLFWWTLAHHGSSAPGTMILFVFTTALYSTLLGALLTFAPQVWYPAYGILPYAWDMTPLADQQLAGVIMWVPAGVVYLGAALWLLGAWLVQAEEGQRQVVRPGNVVKDSN